MEANICFDITFKGYKVSRIHMYMHKSSDDFNVYHLLSLTKEKKCDKIVANNYTQGNVCGKIYYLFQLLGIFLDLSRHDTM